MGDLVSVDVPAGRCGSEAGGSLGARALRSFPSEVAQCELEEGVIGLGRRRRGGVLRFDDEGGEFSLEVKSLPLRRRNWDSLERELI